jgi:hypothetical protein
LFKEYHKEYLELSKSRTYGALSDIFHIGPRWAGTDGESKAKQYIYDKFTSNGLKNVHLEEFEYLNYMPLSSEIKIISPQSRTLVSESLAYSSNGSAEGDLIFVGAGTHEDFLRLEKLGIDFKDKIVMVKTESPFLTYPIAEKHQVGGIICTIDTFSHSDVIFHGSSKMPVDLKKPPEEHKGTIPGVTMLIKDADFFLSLLSAGKVKVRIKQEGAYSLKKSCNIIGSLAGVEYPEQKIVVGGHYDTMWDVPGAWDNAAGCAGMIELARAMADLKLKKSIVFCAFGCEEIGSWGSSEYIKAHNYEMDKHIALIFMEPGGAYPSNSLWTTPKIMDFALKTAKDECSWRVDELYNKIQNFLPLREFVEESVEVIWARDREMNPYYHTERDTIEYIDSEKLISKLYVSGLCAYKLACLSDLPWQ